MSKNASMPSASDRISLKDHPGHGQDKSRKEEAQSDRCDQQALVAEIGTIDQPCHQSAARGADNSGKHSDDAGGDQSADHAAAGEVEPVLQRVGGMCARAAGAEAAIQQRGKRRHDQERGHDEGDREDRTNRGVGRYPTPAPGVRHANRRQRHGAA
jgi:hypothetical protein